MSVTGPTYLLSIVHSGREDLARGIGDSPHLATCVVHDVADMPEDHADLLRWVGAPRNL